MTPEQRNRKIVDAVVEKASRVCPDSLALIGVYGSFASGDIHEKSDLDLLIVINDERGWQLGCAFVQEDLQIGHDIYCTTWESLRSDAEFTHPNIAKLLDAKIVWCADEKYLAELESLRESARRRLSEPLTREDFAKAKGFLREAEHLFTQALVAESDSALWYSAGGVIYYLESAVAMLNKRYFRLGVKRAYDELAAMPLRPQNLCELIDAVASADSPDALKHRLTELMRETLRVFDKVEVRFAEPKRPASADNLRGTYEEMYSNWRNKLHLAAETGNRHLALMSLVSMQAMLDDIAAETQIGEYDALGAYDPFDLRATADAVDRLLESYLAEYERADVPVKRYADIEAFVADYLA